jgi:hypothetical protein
MKRQIYVPFAKLEEGKIPEIAVSLSKDLQLGIQIGKQEETDITEITVIQIPETDILSYKREVKKGFLNPIDYTNEFITFPSSVFIKITDEHGNESVFAPRVRESHSAKFRVRMNTEGQYSFKILSEGDAVIAEGTFGVL